MRRTGDGSRGLGDDDATRAGRPRYWYLGHLANRLGLYQGVQVTRDETTGWLRARMGKARMGKERVLADVLERGSDLIFKWGRRDTCEAPVSDVTAAAQHIVALLADRCR
jgi:hypothetical protein